MNLDTLILNQTLITDMFQFPWKDHAPCQCIQCWIVQNLLGKYSKCSKLIHFALKTSHALLLCILVKEWKKLWHFVIFIPCDRISMANYHSCMVHWLNKGNSWSEGLKNIISVIKMTPLLHFNLRKARGKLRPLRSRRRIIRLHYLSCLMVKVKVPPESGTN